MIQADSFLLKPPCGAIHFAKIEDSAVRIFNDEPDVVLQLISKQVLSRIS